MWILLIVVIVTAVYLFMIAPNSGRQEKMKPFCETYIAHRGLFDNNGADNNEAVDKAGDKIGGKATDILTEGINALENREHDSYIIPENSLPAFERAVEKGYGIELDVQTTSDGRLVVFHDETLKRMCGVDKKLYECTYDELMQYSLAGTEYKIPLFDEVLAVIAGKVPLIVEIKSEGNLLRTTRMTAERLDSYIVNPETGAWCVESFHPLVLRWLKKNRPDVLRGQLSTNFFKSKIKRAWYEKLVLTNLMLNFLSRPDFVAYNYRYKNQPSFWLCRVLYGVVTAAWTVKSEKVLRDVEKVFDVIIFDSFLPGGKE